MRCKVLFYIHSLNKGGAERVMLSIAEEMNKDEEFEVVILTDKKDEREYELPDGLRRIIIENENSDMSSFSRIREIRRYIMLEKPDKIIAFMLSSAVRAVVATIFTKYRIIAAVRSNPYDDYSRGRKRIILLQCMKRCERIVCQTEYQAEFFGQGYKEKCVVISNPIFKEFALKAQSIRRKVGLENNKDIAGKIVATGRLYDYKNHKLLIDAFSIIADDFKNVNLIIYGEGPYREELENKIQNLGLSERVLLPGDSDKVADDICDALIYVLPSDTEGLPNALMEAMALGLPVIATDCPCGGPRSLIKSGVNGILVPIRDNEAMTDAIRKLLMDGVLRDKMGQEAKNILNTNDLGRIVGEWKSICRCLKS